MKNRHRYKPIEKALRVRQRYDLTIGEYNALMAKPCAICGDESSHLDHCHATGKIRGALCQRCNHGLGHFRDDPSLMVAAARYIKRHSATAEREADKE